MAFSATGRPESGKVTVSPDLRSGKGLPLPVTASATWKREHSSSLCRGQFAASTDCVAAPASDCRHAAGV